MQSQLKLLIVAEHAEDFDLLRNNLMDSAHMQYELFRANDLISAKKILSQKEIDATLVVDTQVEHHRYLILDTLHKFALELPIIIITATQDDKFAVQALKRGAQDCITQAELSQGLLSRAVSYSIIRKNANKTLKEEKLRFAIQYQVALALAESAHLNSAAYNILKAICEILDWQVGEIWAIDPNTQMLRYVADWSTSQHLKQLEKISQSIELHEGEGLPGHIWKIKNTYLCADMSQQPLSTRATELAKLGLKSCFGFPILFQGQTLGVIVFFGESIKQFEINLSTVFQTIGEQIGTFIRRNHVEGDLIYLTQHDVLTGLANRVVLEDSLTTAIKYAKKNKEMIALMYVGLDNFKKMNAMGHATGDQVLQEVANRLAQCVRPTDTIARFSGDVFVILLPEISLQKDVEKIANKLLSAIEAPFLINENQLYITASIGISVYPADGDNPQAIMQNAEIAMHHAKTTKGNNYHFSLPSSAMLTQQRVLLETDLHRAVKNQEFLLHYQPKVSAKTNKICGVEALIRWRHPDGRMISPIDFIPLAEEARLIRPMGEWALRTACQQLKQWQEQGLDNIDMAINMSVQQLNEDLIDLVQNILEETGLRSRHLELELTESTLMHETEKNIALLYAIQELGISLSIDDFGTGYSSFAYLKSFSIDSLKIDQSFVRGLPDDAHSREIVRAIIAMAHSLDIKIIAEGIETKGQLDFLHSVDCDQYQGYYFSKPLPPQELLEYCRKVNGLNQ